MILHRVIQHFRNQEWTAIAIDFVIVVVGVFVGIQVANWNTELAERDIVKGHLSEIAEDLQSHLDFHPSLYGSAVARIAAADYLYAQAFDRQLPDQLVHSSKKWPVPGVQPIPAEELNNIMGWLNLVRITVSSRSGYESLISSGHLGLMQNRSLARAIQLYYGVYDDLLDTNKVFRQFRNDGAAVGYGVGVSIFDERPVEEIVALMREHKEFAAYVRTVREWAILHANLLQETRLQTEALLTKINNEMVML